MGAKPLRRAAWAVSRGGEAQHRRVVLCEFLQAGDVADVNAVLEVGTHRDAGDFVRTTWFPRQQLEMMIVHILNTYWKYYLIKYVRKCSQVVEAK